MLKNPVDTPELHERVTKLEHVTSELRESGSRSDKGVLSRAQSILTFALGLTAIFTASGFVIVNSYLATYTTVHGYSINPSQYVSAAIGALVFSLVIYYALTFLLGLVTAVWISFKSLRVLSQSNSPILPVKLNNYVPPERTLRVLVVAMIILGSAVYGSFFYGHIPRHLGGGAPTKVSIILVDNEITDMFDIYSPESNVGVVNRVELLAELVDGLLVYDPVSGIAAIIKNSEIKAVFDANSLQRANIVPISANEPVTAENVAATPESLP